jgi:hypothetical protein
MNWSFQPSARRERADRPMAGRTFACGVGLRLARGRRQFEQRTGADLYLTSDHKGEVTMATEVPAAEAGSMIEMANRTAAMMAESMAANAIVTQASTAMQTHNAANNAAVEATKSLATAVERSATRN